MDKKNEKAIQFIKQLKEKIITCDSGFLTLECGCELVNDLLNNICNTHEKVLLT